MKKLRRRAAGFGQAFRGTTVKPRRAEQKMLMALNAMLEQGPAWWKPSPAMA